MFCRVVYRRRSTSRLYPGDRYYDTLPDLKDEDRSIRRIIKAPSGDDNSGCGGISRYRRISRGFSDYRYRPYRTPNDP